MNRSSNNNNISIYDYKFMQQENMDYNFCS
jgi:hypothetical protein